MLSLIAGLMLACGAAAGDSLDSRMVALMTVNGEHPATVIVHLQHPDAWVPQQELRGAGLLWRDAATRPIDGVAYVSLQSIRPAVTFRVDPGDATLDVAARAESFQARRVDLGRPAAPPTAPRVPNAFLNYSTTAGPGIRPRYQAELGATLRGAVLQSSVAWANGSMARGPATITYDRPHALLRIEAGEARVPGVGSAPAAGFLGVALSRQLEWDPALLRYSPLHLSGETAVPADVDVYVNNQLVQRMRLDAGPFERRNLSPSAGAGVARVVVRDDDGRQQEISTSFYRSPRVLRPGLQEFAYGAGRARRETLGRSAQYQGFAVAGQHRVGVTDGWTLGAYGRRAPSATEAGLESAFRLPFSKWRCSRRSADRKRAPAARPWSVSIRGMRRSPSAQASARRRRDSPRGIRRPSARRPAR
jgi:outer membrane usher protein